MTPGKISVIWPFWNRGDATRRGLASMRQHYASRPDLEIILVDDGSPENRAFLALGKDATDNGHQLRVVAALPPQHLDIDATGIRVRLVELPIKHVAKNPCTPINRGVAASDGEFIVLTNPETTHRAPLLDALRETCQRLGPATYAHAAVWCPQSNSWHNHSEHARAGYHFLGMLRRDLFNAAGGFDEEYRDGYCFDDPDWVQRVLRAGAKFVFRDDLIADHHQDLDGKAHMDQTLWDRNHDLYWRKWPNAVAHDGRTMTHAMLNNFTGA